MANFDKSEMIPILLLISSLIKSHNHRLSKIDTLGGTKMEHKCAWCQVDVDKQQKFKAEELVEGKCEACGSWNDIGQRVITVNSMKQMYQGCLNLMQYVAETCGEILRAADVDIDEIKKTLDMGANTPLSIEIGNWQIVKMLFLMHGSSGGTSTGNLTHLLGLKKDSVSFPLEEMEMCTNSDCPYYKEDEECPGYEGPTEIY